MGTRVDDYRLQLGATQYVPIMIGGMGVDISTADLALEAARLGGIGHLSDAMALHVSDQHLSTRFTQRKAKAHSASRDSLDKADVKFDLDDLYVAQRRSVESAMSRKRGSGGVFINVMEKLTMGAPRDTLKARLDGALDGGIDGITLSAGLHLHSLALIEEHPRFRDAKIGVIVSSARALKIFLRSAARLQRLPDYVVVEGPLAGGHLGFGDDWREIRLEDIVADVLELLRSQSLDIPVIPAGGIFTGADAVSFLESGAGAVQVATRFVVSREAGLSAATKQVYFNAAEDDVVVTSVSPTGYPLRMLKNSPCLGSNVAPQCEPFGYALDGEGRCSYLDAYAAAPTDHRGRKSEVKDKICLCYHFSKQNCYTCGHYVYRLKDTVVRQPDGRYDLPTAQEVFEDYQFSSGERVSLPKSSWSRAVGR
ncbi:MAG: nitronate monooxygenase [Pseudomonadales bacterium]|nr:nitronate monooxygenase [Pseudomonadales bacterium]